MAFSFFKTHKELEAIKARIDANMANNYKDNAQSAYKDLIQNYEALDAASKLSEKQKSYYREVIENYKGKLKGFTHKDQTPYWT